MAPLFERMQTFSAEINNDKSLFVHRGNEFNRRYSLLLRDWNHLNIIVRRLEAADREAAIELNLDLKTLYVFGRVYVETLLHIVRLFVKTVKINWRNLGDFIKSVETNANSEPDEFKLFWERNKSSITKLYETFRYRNYVLHDREDNTEWTFSASTGSNLTNVFIAHVPRPAENGEKEIRTLNAKTLIDVLTANCAAVMTDLEEMGKSLNG